MPNPDDPKHNQEMPYLLTVRHHKKYDVGGKAKHFVLPAPRYTIRKTIGQGAFGWVCGGRKVDTRELVAIKQVRPRSEADNRSILREVSLLKDFRHSNLLPLIDVFACPEGSDAIYLVFPLMDSTLHGTPPGI